MQTLTLASPSAMPTANEQELMLCSVIILRREDAEILVSGQAPGYRLPVTRIPKRQRIAPNLGRGIEEHLGLQTIGRFCVVPEGRHRDTCSIVVDVLDSGTAAPGGYLWLSLGEIRWDDFAPDAAGALWSALARINAYSTGKLAGHFVRTGWYEEVSNWINGSLARSGLTLGGLSSQYNFGPDFALLRFTTSGPAVWFKAVGQRCAREYAITRILADAGFPHIPRVLAVCEDWRGWVSLEAAGRHPGSDTSGAEWRAAARALAELQIASISHTGTLLTAGARDFRVDHLHQAIEPALSRLSALMERQPSVPPHRLGTEEFRTIERQLREACRRLGTPGIPDAVGHSDFNSGNVLIDGRDAVFLDWAESHIGPPCITFAYLELLAGPARSRFRMREVYSDTWKALCLSDQIKTLLDVSPLLAAFAHVLACDETGHPPEDLSPKLAGYLRSLARRMHVEARAVEGEGLL